jgi:hypothetical protein
MVSTSLMVDTSSHPRAQLHRCVERSAYGSTIPQNFLGLVQLACLLILIQAILNWILVVWRSRQDSNL